MALWMCGVLPPAQGQNPDDPQRIPRQTTATTAAVQGVIRTQAGLGLGDVLVVLEPEGGGAGFTTNTTGDGVFRMLQLAPGRYRLRAAREGFLPMERVGIALAPGETFGIEATLESVARPPEPGIPPAPDLPSVYRNNQLPRTPAPGVALAPGPAILPPAGEVFAPAPDRWKYEYPEYRRYGPPGSKGGDVQITKGHWYDPFNRNKLKGDYPVIGQRTFLNLLMASDTFADGRRLPTTSNLGSVEPDAEQFFGRFGQYFMAQNISLSAELFRGNAAYRPPDWRIKFTPEININYFKVRENGIVNIDVRKGSTRLDTQVGLQEAFVEYKIKDLSDAYDFASVRAGIQTFNSDFKGFVFFDQEPGVRIFGNYKANRYQYNLAYFAMLEKDSNSGLNSMSYRGRQVMVANLYRQDFWKPGYTIQASFHYDKDDATLQFDTNNFLVRPAAIGLAKPHNVRSYYYGLTGDGHFGRINVTHAFYQVLGHDSKNLIAGRGTDINAQMAAAELSIDKDWFRIRGSVFFASGDDNPRDGTARGFDAILDNSNFAGGFFSFWNREGIRLTGSGVALVQGGSLLPSLRSSKTQGQANFVNPGLFVYNAGVDVEVTPRWRAVLNFNAIQFHHTEPLELLLFQAPIRHGVGADTGLGFVYRPAISDNVAVTGGFNVFSPFGGFNDIYSTPTLYAGFVNVRFQF